MKEEERKEEEDGLKINDDVVINIKYIRLYFITTFSLC